MQLLFSLIALIKHMNVILDSNLRYVTFCGTLGLRMKNFVTYPKKYVTHLIRKATTLSPLITKVSSLTKLEIGG